MVAFPTCLCKVNPRTFISNRQNAQSSMIFCTENSHLIAVRRVGKRVVLASTLFYVSVRKECFLESSELKDSKETQRITRQCAGEAFFYILKLCGLMLKKPPSLDTGIY